MKIDKIKFITEMAKKNLNQKDLAQKANLSKATVSYIVNGKSCADETVQKLAKALDVDVKELLEEV